MSFYKQEILDLLNRQGIPYRCKEHPPVFTMEEMTQQGILEEGRVCKNLFLRNHKGNRHILVSLPAEKHADLKNLGALLDGERLSFASEQRLQAHLGVGHGAVSPLGILNDEGHAVTVLLDEELLGWDAIGVHPNDNTATVWLAPEDLLSLLRSAGNPLLIRRL